MTISGYAHFDASLVTLPADAFRIDESHSFFGGLGAAMAIAVYDYLGYYNICHLGDEVVEPGKTIPRAVMISVALVAVLYLTMNLAIIGVVPWQQAMESKFLASEFMEILYGRQTAEVFTWLILWTVAASVFALMLGYSRIPYAAARAGGFFPVFAIVHPVHPSHRVALALGLLAAVFCYLPLQDVIEAAVTVRILVQFIGRSSHCTFAHHAPMYDCRFGCGCIPCRVCSPRRLGVCFRRVEVANSPFAGHWFAVLPCCLASFNT